MVAGRGNCGCKSIKQNFKFFNIKPIYATNYNYSNVDNKDRLKFRIKRNYFISLLVFLPSRIVIIWKSLLFLFTVNFILKNKQNSRLQ
jgi:hypothetical protein